MRHTRLIRNVLAAILLLLSGVVVEAQSDMPQDVLLNATGSKQAQARQQLDELQQQISEQTEKTTDPQQQSQMIQQRLDILHTLAVDARLNQQPQQAARWQQALRSDAWKLRQSDNPQQRLVGEYWHMLCDLTDLRRLARDLESSQRASIDRMEQFLASHLRPAESIQPQSMHLLQQVQLALLQLYDQRGQSSQACRLINQLKQQDPENLALNQYLQTNFGYCHLIGRKFNTRLITTDGKTWDSREKRDKPIVIYFWPGVKLYDSTRPDENLTPMSKAGLSDLHGNTDPLWSQMSRIWAHVLLVDLSRSHESGLQISASPWPCYRQEPGQFQLTDYFHIQTLPRVVVIDKNGIIQAVGGPASASILNQLLTDK